MKNKILFIAMSIIASMFSVQLHAQLKVNTYEPHQAVMWYGIQYYHSYPQEEYTPLITNLTYSLGADTLINGKQYHQILFTHEYEHITNAYRGGIRQSEDRQQVYFVPWGAQTEYLLYDFSVKKGDTVYAYAGFHDVSCVRMLEDDPERTITPAWAVMDVQTINGRKHIIVKKDGDNFEWIEGIGTRYILWSQGRTCYATGMEIRFQHTLCAADSEGNILYSFNTDNIGIRNNCEDGEIIETIDYVPSHRPVATKILCNDQILIERDDKTYTLTGQRIIHQSKKDR